MTEIEKKALVQAVAAAGRRMQDYNIMAEENPLRQSIEAHARAIEQHEAFQQEVSDAVEDAKRTYGGHRQAFDQLERFIIPKPDPRLAEVWGELFHKGLNLDGFLAALAKRGLQVTEIER